MPKKGQKIDYPTHRKTPIRHQVRQHTRQGRPVRSFARGRGFRHRNPNPHRVILRQVHPAIVHYGKFKNVPRLNQALRYALLVGGVKEARERGVDRPLTENLKLAFHKNGKMKRRVYYGLLEWTSWKSSSLDENERLAANYIRTWAWTNKNIMLQGRLGQIEGF